jgi:Na+(H+)/acetate symporter ActP
MKNNPTGILISSTLILIIIVFFKWEGDMTFRFSSVVLLFNSIGLQFVDKKLKKISQIISIIAFLLVLILGFGFNYFKY